jgi:hypothetical protein
MAMFFSTKKGGGGAYITRNHIFPKIYEHLSAHIFLHREESVAALSSLRSHVWTGATSAQYNECEVKESGEL